MTSSTAHSLAGTALARFAPRLVQRSAGCDEVLSFTLKSAADMHFLMLNRPKAMHALTAEMCTAMLHVLEQRPQLAVLLSSTPARAFCAGGDVKFVTQRAALGDVGVAERFFRAEYTLDYALAAVPRVSILDGVCMGGGMGLCMHERDGAFSFRVATSNAVCALPECAIGLHPDVGASYFLSRLPKDSGATGACLALSGQHVRGIELLQTGLATHLIDADKVEGLLEALVDYRSNEQSPKDTGQQQGARCHEEKVDSIIRSFESESVREQRRLGLKWKCAELAATCFDLNISDDLEKRLEKLRACSAAEDSPAVKDCADSILQRIAANSPQSMKVTLESLQRARCEDLVSSLRREFRTSVRMSAQCVDRHGDFFVGVDRMLSKRRDGTSSNCTWKHASISSVTDAEICEFFEPLDGVQDWSPAPDHQRQPHLNSRL